MQSNKAALAATVLGFAAPDAQTENFRRAMADAKAAGAALTYILSATNFDAILENPESLSEEAFESSKNEAWYKARLQKDELQAMSFSRGLRGMPSAKPPPMLPQREWIRWQR